MSTEDRERIAAYFAAQEDVDVAYLFGSQAAGNARLDSDVDIAVLLAPGQTGEAAFRRRLQMMAELARALGASVDVVLLDEAGPLLRYEAVRHRDILFCGSRERHVSFLARCITEYLDWLPVWTRYDEAQRRRLAEGSFGRARPDDIRALAKARTVLAQAGGRPHGAS